MGVANPERSAARELVVHAVGTASPTTPLRLIGTHLAAGTVYLFAGAVGLVWIAPDLANGLYLATRVASITHLFTLGWLTLTIFGVLYQFVPVAFGTPVHSVKMAYLAFWLLAPGVGTFVFGVATGITPVLAAGVALVAFGILLEAGNIAGTLARARTRDVTWAAITIALQFLIAVLVFGTALADNLMQGVIARARVQVLAVHLHLALVGWALIAIVGVSRRMLPMFALSPGADTRWSHRALVLLTAGLPTLAIGLLVGVPAIARVGALLLDGGVAAFAWQIYVLYRGRIRRPLDGGVRFVRTALPFILASATMGTLVIALGIGHIRLATAYVVTGLLGGIMLFVAGVQYEIVPLLTWTARFGGRMRIGPLPAAADLYSPTIGRTQLMLHVTGVVVLLSGITIASPFVARTGSILFLCAIVLFVYQLGRISWGAPVGSGSTRRLS
jgi:hypothetical protein